MTTKKGKQKATKTTKKNTNTSKKQCVMYYVYRRMQWIMSMNAMEVREGGSGGYYLQNNYELSVNYDRNMI